MASRKTIFANDEFYHIYNRGVERREIFVDEKDYRRFLLAMNLVNDKNNGLMQEYRDAQRTKATKARPSELRRSCLRNGDIDKLVEIICYCLNSNHYHMILKQKEDGGIEKFMQKLGTSYVMYFNKKQKRNGSLFQGKFKSIHIDSNEYLLYLSAYINQNHFIHGYKDKNWQYSSYLDFTGERSGILCNKEEILGQFRDVKDYKEFVKN
ncbi:MAG: transposase, partial [Patescibacteria group bacterium]